MDNRYRRGGQTDVRLALYDYVHDDVGARSAVVNSGPAFDADAFTLYGYNDRHELTASRRYVGSDPNSPDPNSIVNNQYLAYSYDPIGNRQTYKQGAAAGDPNMVYTTNDVNQYEHGRVTDEPDMALLPQYDDDGNLTRLGAAGDLDCDGDVDFFDIDAWDEALEGQAAFEAAYPGCNWYAADLDGDGDVDTPVDAPDGTDAETAIPFSRVTNTRSVGLPRESRISMASTDLIVRFILDLQQMGQQGVATTKAAPPAARLRLNKAPRTLRNPNHLRAGPWSARTLRQA